MSNSYKGFWIKRLILESDMKKTVQVKFSKGLNVVSGSSDTGKSYIFECINYVLGGSDKPKNIIEAKDYIRFILEIEEYDGGISTIIRNINGEIYIYNCTYQNIVNNTPQKLAQKFSNKNSNNIATVLAKLSNFKYSKILGTKGGIIKNFTFREMIHLNMIDEERIIRSKSIVFDKNGNMTSTKNKSVFRTIITGKDDSDIIIEDKKEEKKINKSLINNLIDELKVDLIDDGCSINYSLKIDEVNNSIKKVKEEIESYSEIINELEVEFQSKKSEERAVSDKLLYYTEILKRFQLLKQNYESDIARLEFVDESKYYLEQLIDLNCPLCKTNLVNKITEEQSIDLRGALLAEQKKLLIQISDLEVAIFESELEKDNYSDQSQIIKDELNALDIKLTEITKGDFNKRVNLLESLMSSREEFRFKEQLTKKIDNLVKLRNEQEDISDNEVEKDFNKQIESKILQDICDIAKELLINSNVFSKVEVSFNPKTMDFILDNSDKKTFGKGYKALINSAFCIAIIKYTYRNKIPNTGFVVIDSPLTAFKDKENKEGINEAVKHDFYITMSNIKEDIQIIILDNEVPPKELEDEINSYNFSGNNKIGRKGFL